MSRILLPFVAAGIVALLCAPLIERALARTRWPRWVVCWLLLLALLSGVLLLGWLIVPPLASDLLSVGSDLQGALQGLFQGLLGGRILDIQVDPAQLASEAVARLRQWAGGDTILLLGAQGAEGFFAFILFWVLLAYFLLDEPRISAGLLWLVPPARRSFALRVWGDLEPTLRRYFAGVAVIAAYTTLAAYLGLGGILRLHHALFLALLTGIFELLPVLGPLAAAVIAGLVAIGQYGGGSHVLAYVGYATALRVSIDQLVGPIVLGRAGRLPPVLVMFCFLVGGVLFGVTGVILSVPIALAVKSLLTARHAALTPGAL
jgi:predicted PurR-regulated permease PerM